MSRRVFVAGATGVIGKRLVPLLFEAGHEVFGMTRSAGKAEELQLQGAHAIVADVYDESSLMQTLSAVQPDVVIHQLTDLPPNLDPSRMAEAIQRNARIRTEGTRNLMAAARACGAQKFIAQSIAWAYAPGSEPHADEDPLDLEADGSRGTTVGGVAALERIVMTSPLEGVVLRYGQLYGPGTGHDQAHNTAPLHVDAAAWAAVLAIESGVRGIFNVAEETGYISNEKARRVLGWRPEFRSDTATPRLSERR